MKARLFAKRYEPVALRFASAFGGLFVTQVVALHHSPNVHELIAAASGAAVLAAEKALNIRRAK